MISDRSRGESDRPAAPDDAFGRQESNNQSRGKPLDRSPLQQRPARNAPHLSAETTSRKECDKTAWHGEVYLCHGSLAWLQSSQFSQIGMVPRS